MRNVYYIGIAEDAGATLMHYLGAWKAYMALLISTLANSAKPLTINLPPTALPDDLLVIDGQDKDLMAVDSVAGTLLTLTSARESEGPTVVLESTQGSSVSIWRTSVSDILKARTWMQRKYGLGGAPIMSLKAVLAMSTSDKT
ncbi:hypothetical protein HD806DRAFT_526913 [Xylariaceae sp. AK1471]|nr:hypothetical protein HD806DRAFT_526913 [Xylariaceae sp. AK1471]